MRITTRKVAFYGVAAALSLVLGYLEHLVPFPIGIYGIKLGLSNLAIVTVLYLLGGTAAVTLNLVRIFLSSLLFGNAVSLIYSLCGGMLSVAVMILIKHWDKVSCVGVSIVGGIAHNIAQLAVAIVLVDSLKIAFYLPVLLIVGALTGSVIGACALPVIKNKYLQKIIGGKRYDI